MKKIIPITILSLVLFFLIFNTCQAVDLLLEYPPVGEYKLEEASTLPEVIRYIYMFALGAAGIVALLMILIGAIMYIFSAGNSSKAADAKDRIYSALLGILILLASVLILRIINPDLVNIGFTLPKIEETSPHKCVCLNPYEEKGMLNPCYELCPDTCGERDWVCVDVID